MMESWVDCIIAVVKFELSGVSVDITGGSFMKRLLICLFMLSTFTFVQAATKVYRWVDEDGVTHFTGHPPPGQEVETQVIRQDHSPNPAAVAAQNNAESDQAAESELVRQYTGVDAGAKQEQRVKAQQRRDNCARGRQLVETIEPRAIVRVQQADGTTRDLTNEERQTRLQQARKLVSDNC